MSRRFHAGGVGELTLVDLDNFLPDGNCVVLLDQVFFHGAGLALSIPHIDSDLVGLNLQQYIIFPDNITCRRGLVTQCMLSHA